MFARTPRLLVRTRSEPGAFRAASEARREVHFLSQWCVPVNQARAWRLYKLSWGALNNDWHATAAQQGPFQASHSPSLCPPTPQQHSHSSFSRPQQAKRDYDYLFKLVLIGDTGVGKSCLLLRFADDGAWRGPRGKLPSPPFVLLLLPS